jgi:hypothetical protein
MCTGEEIEALLRQLLHRHERDLAHASLAVRSHVALHHEDLDRDLADGVPVATSAAHAERARQLLGRHVRRELAGGIDGILARAEHPPHWHTTVLPVEAPAVRTARRELVALRDALLDDGCRSWRGVAQAAVLVHDQDSPVYSALAAVTVADAATSARASLAAVDGSLPGA